MGNSVHSVRPGKRRGAHIKRPHRRVDITLVILVTLVLVAAGTAFWKGGWELTGLGLAHAGQLIQTVWFRLILGITLGGLIQVLVPRNLIARWLGPASGLKGVLTGAYLSIIVSGPPYVMLPVVASLYTAGAGPGPIIAMMTGQTLIGLQMLLAWEIPFLGMGLPLSKYIVGLVVVPVVGLAGSVVYRLLKGVPDIRSNPGEGCAPDPGDSKSRASPAKKA